MAMQPFTNFGVSSYISSLSDSELRVFTDNLKKDFDGTIYSTFSLSSSQLKSLASMPSSAKMNVVNGLDNYTSIKESGIKDGTVDVSGLDPAGSDRTIIGIGVHTVLAFDIHIWKWTIKINIEVQKDNS